MLRLTVGFAVVTLVICSQCPNNEVCEPGQSCCQDPAGGFSCCPFHQGECCEDHLHCCPEGMLCSVKDLTCTNATHTQPLVDRTPAKKPDLPKSFRMIFSMPASESDITCPDGSSCPAEFSCLLMSTSYGCCPLAQGLACSDGKHCCPNDHECSTDSSLCVKRKVKVQTVLCGNGTSECPADTTCCQAEDGQWGCCPMPKAVCCDDKIHCCPEDSVCDVKALKCITSTNQELPMWDKFPARLRAEWEDHKQKQPETQSTTTKPTGTTSTTTAANQVTTLPAEHQGDVSCNDTAACPDGSTCCKTKDGGWACCPLPEAVCCEDFIHCCPHGKKCDVAAGSCEDPSGSVPWVEKVPVHLRAGQRPSGKVNCNATHSCPESSTCCKNIAAEWGCCPFSQAVCCRDGFHCCPQGTSCDFVTLTCTSNSTSVPMSVLIPPSAKKEQTEHEEVKVTVGKYNNRVPCDAQTSCPEYTTCCLIAKTNKWGCCPLPNAVCCTDGEHCCPAHYKCNVSSVSCVKGDVVIPWYNKLAVESTPAPRLDYGAVKCDDQSSCSADSTCCRLSKGEWGCCPFPEAVCCPDQKHCCPEGYRCDLRRRSCVKTTRLYVEITQLTQLRSNKPQPSVTVKDLQCGGGFNCRDGETCCPTSQNTWGCCPSTKAVCCADMQHCCPAGYKCGPGGTCISAGDLDWSNWVNWKLFFSKKKRAITL